jgi:hypothetical protein
MKTQLLTAFLVLLAGFGQSIIGQSSIQAKAHDLEVREAKEPIRKASYSQVRKAAKKDVKTAVDGATGSKADSLAGAAMTKALVEKIFPAWYGTPWDFNGHTNTPDTGEVACGYFVSTTLKHMGFNLNRYKLAQQASMIGTKSLDPHENESFWGKSVDKLVEYFKPRPAGLWTVGLSYHVGFLYWDGAELYFIHSSYLDPVAVVREKALESEALAQSNVFCLGNITHNQWLMRKWRTGEFISIYQP